MRIPRTHWPRPGTERVMCGLPQWQVALATAAGAITCGNCRYSLAEPWHGTPGGYSNHNCDCDRCRQANTEAQRGIRDRLSAGPVPPQVHGTTNGYTNYRCRCRLCTAAHTASRTAWRRKIQEQRKAGSS